MRKLRGMTQTELGKGLGTDGADVGKQVVYGWEKDQHYPRVDQLILICEKLSCSADHLLFGNGAMTISPKFLAAQKAGWSLVAGGTARPVRNPRATCADR